MNHKNWYVSLNYAYDEMNKMIEILNVLEYKKYKLLCRQHLWCLSELSADKLDTYINLNFNLYLRNLYSLHDILDVKVLENSMRDVFINKYGHCIKNMDFINAEPFSIKRLLDKFKDIDEQTLYALKYTFSELVQPTSKLKKSIFSNENIRFKQLENHSLSHYLNVSHNLTVGVYAWYEINSENDFEEMFHSSFHDLNLILTTDLENMLNFTYYINIFEIYGLHVSIHDNKNQFNDFIRSELIKICGKGRKFKKFNERIHKKMIPWGSYCYS